MLGLSRRNRTIRDILNWLVIALVCICFTTLYNGRGFYEVKVTVRQGDAQQRLEIAGNDSNSVEVHNDPGAQHYVAQPNIRRDISTKLPLLSNSSEWLECDDLERIYESIKEDYKARFRKMTRFGHRAIYFTTVTNPHGNKIEIALKVAVVFNPGQESDVYRYRSALREIDNIRKLSALGWKGVPALHGACVTSHRTLYAVERVRGKPLCDGNGTDRECAMAHQLMQTFEISPSVDPLLWLYKVTHFFKQFETHGVFMEDISGSNFFYNPKTFDIYVVDADSMIFYGNSTLLSRTSCRSDAECAQPRGNFWGPNALNHKIYFTCRESQPYCNSNACWGMDASLHNCGVGRWLISPLRTVIPPRAYSAYRDIMHCLMEKFPQKRCSMTEACDKADRLRRQFSQPYNR